MYDTPAGSQEGFLKKLTDGFRDCYDISQSWPQTSIDRRPDRKIYGRHTIFFECVHEVEDDMCFKFQMNQWLASMYGNDYWTGLNVDRWDAAALTVKSVMNSSPDEEKFVGDFFWQPSNFRLFNE